MIIIQKQYSQRKVTKVILNWLKLHSKDAHVHIKRKKGRNNFSQKNKVELNEMELIKYV